MQTGCFDQQDRLEKLGDPLPRLDSIVHWYLFRPLSSIDNRLLITDGWLHSALQVDPANERFPTFQ